MKTTRAVSEMTHGPKAQFFNYLREVRIKQRVQNHVAVGAAFQMPLDLTLDRRGEPPL